MVCHRYFVGFRLVLSRKNEFGPAFSIDLQKFVATVRRFARLAKSSALSERYGDNFYCVGCCVAVRDSVEDDF